MATTAGPSKKRKYEDPLAKPARKTPEFKDPLRHTPSKFKLRTVDHSAVLKGYDTKFLHEYHEYKLPDIDPLSGKPRPKRKPKVKPEPKPEEKISKSKPKPKIVLPTNAGSSVGSMKRMLRIQDNMNF